MGLGREVFQIADTFVNSMLSDQPSDTRITYEVGSLRPWESQMKAVVRDFTNPEKVCDIVLKGGITSGIVYPLALVSLAEEYRFSSIGGTSAGAIAASATAAAEYGRHIRNAGFERLARIPDEIGHNLLSMFQPTPVLKPIFEIFLAFLKPQIKLGRASAVLFAAIRGYWGSALFGAALGLGTVGGALAFGGGSGLVAFGLLLALVGLVGAVLWRVLRAAQVELVNNEFGLCPGIRQPYASSEAFTDWLARLIDEAAGRGTDTDRPLTFGELAAPSDGRPPIELAMMTTSLMERRPYTLPMTDRRFVFKKSEWDKIFPRRVMAFLTQECDSFAPPAGESGEYYYFPDQARLPVIVATRMSLSFPGLITAVPLWRRDFTLANDTERNKLRRCLMSDGGLSSNFPIHFFDRLLPSTPTFAISLDEYSANRHRDGAVWLPSTAASGTELPIQSFDGLGGFLMRLIDSAKDWQDNLQSTLPGYRERIAHVALKSDEGGLNLAMDAATIRSLARYGEQAGEVLRNQFDFDSHRWRRFLVAMARIEETLDEVAKAYDGSPGSPEAFSEFLARYAREPDQYKQETGVLAAMLTRGKQLAATGVEWRLAPTLREGHIPKPATTLRISPKP
jgi:predicted acylesterase/phospholipase RssA